LHHPGWLLNQGRRSLKCWSLLAAVVLWAATSVSAQPSSPTDSAEPARKSAAESAKKKGPAQAAKQPAARSNDIPPNPFPNRIPAADLTGGVEWLNTAGPLSLKQLRGKVVLLDFWTFCCINCIHVIPELKFLEAKYPHELVVIGVHSAKFHNEKESGNIRQAILRYEIEHPVVNDAEMILWRKFGVNSWPTLVLIDPEGFYCGYVSGEGNRDLLDAVIQKVIAHHRAKGTLDETPLRFALERDKEQASPLRFPGKVLADEASQRLFIADSNHNRIVVATLDGQLLDVIGSGRIGNADGSYAEAQFDHPQGMALVGETLYVADTENHLLRKVDLQAKQVTTLAGTGEQGYLRAGRFKLREVGLNSPWDLLHLNGVLYICMAGPHQIWSHQLGSNWIQPYAGSGREDIRNGSLQEAALAQPSGIATDGTHLYVCDSEGSAIRKITTPPGNNLQDPAGEVTTVVGTSNLPNGRSLFEFGDVDGVGKEVRLQHPLGIVFHDGGLFVADSYNHKIKHIDLKKRKCITWLGTGKPGDALDPPQLAEPAGLAVALGKLYVADTNNHRIAVVDLNTKAMSVLTIAGLKPPEVTTDAPGIALLGPREAVPVQKIAPAHFVEFEVAVLLPAEFKLNPAAPVTYQLTTDAPQTLIAQEQLNVREEAAAEGTMLKFRVPLAGQTGEATFHLAINYQYCREGERGVCKLGGAQYAIPIHVAKDANSSVIRLTATAK
jgi:thiol-disulfide isomerase/thioredoxin